MAVSLLSIRNQPALYAPTPSKGQALKAALSANIHAAPQSDSGVELLGFREEFPPVMLHDADIATGPISLYKIMRSYLVLHGTPYQPHPTRSPVSWGPVSQLYVDE